MYKKESENLLKELFCEEWMDEDDWNEFLVELDKATGLSTIDQMSNDIETGIKNGHSLEKQIEICKEIFKKMK